MKTQAELYELAMKLADEAQAAGCYGVIIVALSDEHPVGHSSYQIVGRGRCIEVEGLASRVAAWASEIWIGKQRWGHQVAREAARTEGVMSSSGCVGYGGGGASDGAIPQTTFHGGNGSGGYGRGGGGG